MNLKDAKVVVTGSFDGRPATEVRAELESMGAVVADDVAPDVEYVFAGTDAGPEYDAAQELGLSVRDEAATLAILAGDEPAARHAEEPIGAPLEAIDEDVLPFDPTDGGAPPDSTPTAQSENEGERVFDKGARVRIVGGLEGVGVVGEIFWWGESKYGEGMRAGVRDADGEAYWVDEQNLGWPEEEVPEEVAEIAKAASEFRRGDEVRVVSGKDEGATGTIFWWGESKWGNGMRAGVETGDGDKVWVDAEHLEAVEDEGDDDIPF